MLEIKNLSKSYDGKNYACKDVTLTIDNGDIYGFIGPNGAGKSTTIKAVCGIHSFEGEVLFDGVSIKKEPVKFKKDIAHLFQIGQITKEFIDKRFKLFDFTFEDFDLKTSDVNLHIEQIMETIASHRSEILPVNPYFINGGEIRLAEALKKALDD